MTRPLLHTDHPSLAFLMLYLGELPPYFTYWARTCEPNHPGCHWFVYNDRIPERTDFNRAVTLIPYSFDRLRSDMAESFGIRLPAGSTRMVCDCRILLYAFRKDADNLSQYDFIGYSDLDVLYGRIADFLPENPGTYTLISAADDRPCGPFTLFSRKHLSAILMDRRIKERFESNLEKIRSALPDKPASGDSFMPMTGNSSKDRTAACVDLTHIDESRLLKEIAEALGPIWCRAEGLQPARVAGFNYRKAIALWQQGRLHVRDILGRQREGAFFHFSRFKNRSRFRVTPGALDSDCLGVYKYGIIPVASPLTRLRMFLTLLY